MNPRAENYVFSSIPWIYAGLRAVCTTTLYPSLNKSLPAEPALCHALLYHRGGSAPLPGLVNGGLASE
jgi:hypothetical protein